MNDDPHLDQSQVQRIHQYIAAYNAFDVDAMLALLAPGVEFENWSAGQLTAQAHGIDEFRQLAEHAKTVFSEREQRVTALGRDGESLVARISYRGWLAIDVPDGPRAGTVLELSGESVFSFDGRWIAKIVDRS